QHGLEHAREDPERVDLPLEPLRFFPERRRRPGTERVAVETERQIVSAEPWRPQARGQAFTRQHGQLAKRSHSPPAESRGEIRSEVEGGDGNLRKRRALAPG